MEEKETLRFDAVTVEVRPPYETGLKDLSFVVREGDLVAVFVNRGHAHTPLADAAEGLVELTGGKIMFLGDEWEALSPDEFARRRGRVGRVFEEHGWVSNLDVDENIMLGERHHTVRPEEEIREEAEALAARFGMDGIPTGRSSGLRRADLRRVEWIRAFLGDPALVLLEHPLRNVPPDAADGLMDVVSDHRRKGTAVIWITSDQLIWPRIAEHAVLKLRQHGPQLVRAEGE